MSSIEEWDISFNIRQVERLLTTAFVKEETCYANLVETHIINQVDLLTCIN